MKTGDYFSASCIFDISYQNRVDRIYEPGMGLMLGKQRKVTMGGDDSGCFLRCLQVPC